MKAIILAGGKGKRLAPYTHVLPKPLLPVDDMPILEIIIRQLKHYGVNEIVLCVGYLGSLLETYFRDGKRLGVDITYSYEDQPLGTAGPIGLVDDLREPFLVMNGDILSTIDYGDMIRAHKAANNITTIGLARKTVKIDLGVIELDENNELKDYIEKPEMNYMVSMGIYVFNPEIREFIPREERLDLPDLILNLKAAGRKISSYHRDFTWLDIGRPEDYNTAIDLFVAEKARFLPGEN